jgi:hypothetical protein
MASRSAVVSLTCTHPTSLFRINSKIKYITLCAAENVELHVIPAFTIILIITIICAAAIR